MILFFTFTLKNYLFYKIFTINLYKIITKLFSIKKKSLVMLYNFKMLGEIIIKIVTFNYYNNYFKTQRKFVCCF